MPVVKCMNQIYLWDAVPKLIIMSYSLTPSRLVCNSKQMSPPLEQSKINEHEESITLK